MNNVGNISYAVTMNRKSKTIRVSFEVLEKLKSLKEKETDTADDVLRKLLSLKTIDKPSWDKF